LGNKGGNGLISWQGDEGAVGFEGGLFGGFGDDGEGAEDMGEFGFGEVIQMGDDAVEFGAEFGALGFVGYAIFMATQSDFLGEVVEFGGGTDEFGGTFYDF
jgi:hypothetical protein